MKQTIKILLIFIFILISAMLICIKSIATTTGVITEITVNVREKASVDSKVIRFVTQDDKVEILEKTGDWYKIKFANTQGYVYSEYVKVDNEDEFTNAEETKNEELIGEDEEVTKTIEAKLFIPKKTVLRITPNIISSTIYTTKSDIEITIIEQINKWSYIEVKGIRGWVINEQIKEGAVVEEKVSSAEKKEEEKTTQKNKTAYVKYSSVNLRKEPSTDSKVIQKLTLNTKVTITEEIDSTWVKVKVEDTIGYVSKELLSNKKVEEEKTESTTTSRDGETTSREETAVEKTEKEESKEETKKEEAETEKKKKEEKEEKKYVTGADIVAYAKKYLGYKYVYGGSSPKTGFDCSGFTQYVYKHFGYTISRSSVSQATNGTKVDKKDLQPGDLVIYKNHSLTRIGHVGIYIGNNKMIHASEPGVGVTITDIDSKAHKYPQRYVMGRRIIK